MQDRLGEVIEVFSDRNDSRLSGEYRLPHGVEQIWRLHRRCGALCNRRAQHLPHELAQLLAIDPARHQCCLTVSAPSAARAAALTSLSSPER